MSTQQINSRKELPKVCKKFPEEFFLQRQKTAQSTLGGFIREQDQAFDYDSLRNSNSGSLNKLNGNNSIRLNKNYPQQSINSYNSFSSLPFTSNSRRNPSLPQFQQQQSNTKLLNDLMNSQILRSQNFQNFSSQIQKIQPQSVVGGQQDDKFNNFVFNSKNQTIEDIISSSQNNPYSSINTQYNEEENRKDIHQESIDKHHLSPLLANENQNQQNMNEYNLMSDIKKDTFEGRRSNSNNSYHNFFPKSNSSSSTKRGEIMNKKKVLVSQEIEKQDSTSYDNLANILSKHHHGNILQNNNLSLKKYNQQFIFNTEYTYDANRICQTQENENQPINFQKINIPISQKIFIDKQNSDNNLPQQGASYYNPIRASSSSACFQNYSDNKLIDSLTSIPFFGVPSTQQSNKQLSLHSISSQSTKHSLISKNQLLNKYNAFEPQNSQITINQNYLINSPQTNQISTQDQFYSFRLPRIQLSNHEEKIQTPGSNIKTLLNENNQLSWNIYPQSNQQIKFQNNSTTNTQESNQVFALEQSQQILDQIKLRDIKTPSFNTRKNRQNGTSLRQLTEECQTSNNMLNSQNYLSLLQQQKQMNFTLNLNQFNLKNTSDQSNQISSRQENPSNIQAQSPKTNLYQSNDEINQQCINLNTSFGNYQNNPTKNTEDYYTSINESNVNKKINHKFSKKKSFIQQNFKSSKEQESQQQAFQLNTENQQIIDQTVFSQSKQQQDDNSVKSQSLIKQKINSEIDREKQQNLEQNLSKNIQNKEQESPNQQQNTIQIDDKNKIDDLQFISNKDINIQSDDVQQKKFKRKTQSQQQSSKKETNTVKILQIKQNNPALLNQNIQHDVKVNNNLDGKNISPFNLDQQHSQQYIPTDSSTPISTSEEIKTLNHSKKQQQNNLQVKVKQYLKQGIEKLSLNSDQLKQFRDDQNLMFTFSTPQHNNTNSIKIEDMLNQIQSDKIQQDLCNPKSNENIYSEEKRKQNNIQIQRQRVQSHLLTKQNNLQNQMQSNKTIQNQCYYVGQNNDNESNSNIKKQQKILTKNVNLKQVEGQQKDMASIIKQQYEQIESTISQHLKLQSQLNYISDQNKNSQIIEFAK